MKFYLLFFFLTASVFHAQFRIDNPNFSMKTSTYKVENYDTSLYNVYYRLEFVPDVARKELKKESVCILQVGKDYSKFSDVKQLKSDSLSEKYSHQKEINGKEMEALMNINVVFHPVILKDISKRKITYQGRIKGIYQYQEEQPDFKWKLEKGTKTILGYACKKATVKYKGRDYVAWFTDSISSNNGPYKFEGLPGLILELTDTGNEFHFVAIAIDKKNLPIYLRSEDRILNVTKEKYREVEKNYHDNPGIFHGKAYNADGSPMIVKSKPLPYNPIELE
ncbi:GLPGLI family protein [Chryseobacterium sp. RRHN12]|uniref:GLPGLI family protein n=1 Tax=Chryseobacterium sp. RRHN12 TaxID=3437884 RepID=UPI003D9BEA4C